jgi:hypothetical protein
MTESGGFSSEWHQVVDALDHLVNPSAVMRSEEQRILVDKIISAVAGKLVEVKKKGVMQSSCDILPDLIPLATYLNTCRAD